MFWRTLVGAIRHLYQVRRSINSPMHGETTTVANYSPAVFDAGDLESAKAIILTPAPDMTTAERWEVETRNLVAELGRSLELSEKSIVLDYGCGVGRIAKALIDEYNCSVLGVDISAKMRGLAVPYVGSDRFSVCDPETLDRKIAEGFRATHAYACWVLQHCRAPEEDVSRICAALAAGARFYVLNSDHRWVPTDRGWISDGVSLEGLIGAEFEILSKAGVTHLVGSEMIACESYALLLQKRT